ncbi:hypothetical protein DICPUDRAFT_158703 [Dictyostelium purpureum]|uniref:SAM domain-containing protein n=1 Tax=Dictyostelium purpureum TaxID=5786 RepID=F1A294_DICPU|nr:uncharacterized protein DICPUDRAFT_158703 [Dictyostelium purpureum]EGC29685.1 hypothetical protein DICPUDRAFT_158703 [Dictyostelium purpureum]|eukprot:XP_003293790.1 hypothetical protein DICPUDRAFT_158703 [Dictyostelium purpureum]
MNSNTVYSKDSRDTIDDWSNKKISEWLTLLKFPIEIISTLEFCVVDGGTLVFISDNLPNDV